MGNIATFPQVSTIQEYLRNPGLLAYGELTADQTVGAGAVLNGCTVTVTVPAGRRIRIVGQFHYASTVANDEAIGIIDQGTTGVKQMWHTSTVANRFDVFIVEHVMTPTAGTHSFRLYLSRNSGSGTFTALGSDARRRCHITVEDITGDATAVNPQSVPVGRLGYGEAPSQAVAGATFVQLTGLSVNVTVPAGRTLQITALVCAASSVAGAQDCQIYMDGVKIQRHYHNGLGANEIITHAFSFVYSPSAGSHTFSIALWLQGSGTTYGTTGQDPNYILVEDITPTPAPASSVPSSYLAYAAMSAAHNGITSEANVNGLSATITVPEGRRIKITAQVGFANPTVANTTAMGRIKEGGTTHQARAMVLGQIGVGEWITIEAVLSPSAGSHTYTVSGQLLIGSGTLNAFYGAGEFSFILIEDITAVSVPALSRTGLWTPATAFPTSPGIGDLFYETDTRILWVYGGASWTELQGPPYPAKGYRSTNYDHTPGWNKVPLNAEFWDTESLFDTTLSRYVCAVDGVYTVYASAECWLNNNPQRFIPAIRRNGVEDAHTVWGAGVNIRNMVGGDAIPVAAAGEVRCSAGHYLEFFLYNNGGNNTTITGTALGYGAQMTVRRVGPLIP